MLPINFISMEMFLPFMLVLAVSYGALETAGMFRNRAVKVIIAVVVAFFALTNYMVVQTINSFLPYVALIFLAVFIIGFAKKSLGGREKDNTMMIIMAVLVLLFIGSIANSQGGFGLYQYNEILWILGVVVVAAILYGAYKMK